MKRGLAAYAIGIYGFLHLPLLILAIFSVNASRFTAWQGFSLHWYQAMFADRDLLESAGNSLAIAVASTALSTVIGTLAAYALWKRASNWLAGRRSSPECRCSRCFSGRFAMSTFVWECTR